MVVVHPLLRARVTQQWGHRAWAAFMGRTPCACCRRHRSPTADTICAHGTSPPTATIRTTSLRHGRSSSLRSRESVPWWWCGWGRGQWRGFIHHASTITPWGVPIEAQLVHLRQQTGGFRGDRELGTHLSPQRVCHDVAALPTGVGLFRGISGRWDYGVAVLGGDQLLTRVSDDTVGGAEWHPLSGCFVTTTAVTTPWNRYHL